MLFLLSHTGVLLVIHPSLPRASLICMVQCYTAVGMNPLAALELYYGRKISGGWSIIFLLASQMIGYGFIGIYRDVLVRPPKMYYPGVLPNVSLFSAMHNNPAATKKALKFFTIVACTVFVWEWFPQYIFPLLISLPLVCYFGHGHWKPYILGSGNNGFVSAQLCG
jgi:hypothetical protein